MKRASLFAFLALLSTTEFAPGAHADIIYSLSGQSAGSFTATGTITTDGFIGTESTFTSPHVLSWNITLDDGPAGLTPAILTPGNSTFYSQFITYTATDLSLAASGAIQIDTSGTTNLWQRSNAMGDLLWIRLQSTDELDFTPDSPIFAQAVGGGVVPEPSTLTLAIVGLLSLGFLGWRRRQR